MHTKDNVLNVAFTSPDWRGVALSNFALSPFLLDGVLLASIEGFIQGIKFPPGHPLREQAFVLAGWDAKNLGKQADNSGAYWNDACVPYGSSDHHSLIERAIRTRFEQNAGLRHVLSSTMGMTLVHEPHPGQPEPAITSLPAAVFCRILTDIRNAIGGPI